TEFWSNSFEQYYVNAPTYLTKLSKEQFALLKVSEDIATAQEYIILYPSTLENIKFITDIYTNLLGRDPDNEGRDFWVNHLNLGTIKTDEAIIRMIEGAKSNTTAQGLLDAALIANKSQVSAHFALTLKSNDLTLASRAFELVTSDLSSVDLAIAAFTEQLKTEDVSVVTIPAPSNSSTTITTDSPVDTTPVPANERLEGTSDDDFLTGTDKAETLLGKEGNDILRGGAGIDTMDGGAGDDIFVVVGDLSGGGKFDSDEDTRVLGQPLTELNGVNLNEDENGAIETIIGGEGDDTLYVYGSADVSNYVMTGIEHVQIRSDVIFENSFLKGISDLTGDGNSTVRIVLKEGASPQSIDLSSLALDKIGHIDLGENVTLLINNLDQLGGAHILTGSGAINVTGNALSLPNNYSVTDTLSIINTTDNSNAKGNAQILDNAIKSQANTVTQGTDGNDYIQGTAFADIFEPKKGNDVLIGGAGDDVFKISDSGFNVILDNEGNDTLDLSGAKSSAIINLTEGGILGNDTLIQLGANGSSGAAQEEVQKSNVMLIFDASGSMAWGVEGKGSALPSRLSLAQEAVIELLEAYGENTAVRLVTFSSEAKSSFNGIDEWMDIETAKTIINDISVGGDTYYDKAMDKAQEAFHSGRDKYIDDGEDVFYFLSDGQPTVPIFDKEA
ncbi:MAG: VWA domain-containing protein, partial [Methylococcales bacterium]|nr:VWA domain-containing protein [Methylococcales bacterium]